MNLILENISGEEITLYYQGEKEEIRFVRDMVLEKIVPITDLKDEGKQLFGGGNPLGIKKGDLETIYRWILYEEEERRVRNLF